MLRSMWYWSLERTSEVLRAVRRHRSGITAPLLAEYVKAPSAPAVRYHLNKLEKQGLVRREPSGKWRAI